jgi:hypothetical protein
MKPITPSSKPIKGAIKFLTLPLYPDKQDRLEKRAAMGMTNENPSKLAGSYY